MCIYFAPVEADFPPSDPVHKCVIEPPAVRPKPTSEAITAILAATGEITGIGPGTINSPTRLARICRIRFAVYYIAHRYANLSMPEIGKILGGRDHTTVLHGIQRCREIMGTEPEYARTVRRIVAASGLYHLDCDIYVPETQRGPCVAERGNQATQGPETQKAAPRCLNPRCERWAEKEYPYSCDCGGQNVT